MKVKCAGCGVEVSMPQSRYDSKKYKVFACGAVCRKTEEYRQVVSSERLKVRGYPSGYNSIECYQKALRKAEKHEMECVVCGSPISATLDESPTCRGECREILRVKRIGETKTEKYGSSGWNNPDKRKDTSKEVYGSENWNNREKASKTVMEKYGVDNVSKSEEVKEKIRQSTLKSYGVDSYFKRVDLIKKDWERTLGVDNPQKDKEINERTRKTVKEVYGELIGACPREATERACLERYGSPTFFGSEAGRMTTKRLIEEHGWSLEDILKKRSASWSTLGRASKESLRFFSPILEELESLGVTDYLIGSGEKKEFSLVDKEEGKIWYYDLAAPSLGLVVEYNGCAFHARTATDKLARGNAEDLMERDRKKLACAVRSGFDVIVVWSDECLSAKVEEVIEKIRRKVYEVD